jgi:DNA polymerase III subunit epsilon
MVPWTEARFCVLDLETTGLDPAKDEIISFGSVPIEHGRIRPAGAVNFLVKPHCPIDPNAVKVHTIRNCDLQHQPYLQDRVQDIEAVTDGSFLVAHSAWLDAAFLAKAVKNRTSALRSPMIDTARLARRSLECPPTGRADISLEYAATMLGLPVHAPHTALGDAMTTAQLFLALAHRLSRDRVVSVADLLRLSQQPTPSWHQRIFPEFWFNATKGTV